MRRKTRTKVKKGLLIAGIVIAVILLVIGLVIIVKKIIRKETYEDKIVAKNLYSEITINLDNKEVKRDNIDTNLIDEFGFSNEQVDIAFTSISQMKELFSNSTIDISENGNMLTLTDKFVTKNIIAKSNNIKEKVDGEEIIQIQDNLYILKFETEKLAKAMYEYYKSQEYIDELFYDEIYIDNPANDISQTMYGENETDLNGYHSLGVNQMGLDNYQKIINDNGNPSEIVISTVGYGVNTQNGIFENRISNEYYNFMSNTKNIDETISQGSRIAEVIVDSTTANVKLMPLVVVNDEGYTTVCSILRALRYAVLKSDVICYELENPENDAINLVLDEAFKEEKPICAVASNSGDGYPADNSTTIAVSSLNRNFEIADYSGKGKYIDFAAPSTDVEEIFKTSSSVSRWSGPEYSNAEICAVIALYKTYSKDSSILDIYKFIKNYSNDLGETGKDELYGYGCPIFKTLTISDLDKIEPSITEIKYDNEMWETFKNINIKANDNIRVKRYAVTKNVENPLTEEWQEVQGLQSNIDVSVVVKENGIYYIWVEDSAGNCVVKNINIDKVDIIAPIIDYTIDQTELANGKVTINVSAIDNESGIYDNGYSWDDQNWLASNTKKVVTENGRYTVYVMDNLGNKSSKEIVIDVFPEEGTAEISSGNIIESIYVPSDWDGDANNSVQIKLYQNLDIYYWQITEGAYDVNGWTSTGRESINTNNSNSSNTNSTTTDGNSNNYNNTNTSNQNRTYEQIKIIKKLNIDKDYYVWIKNSKGVISYQSFRIHKKVI